MSGSRSTRTAAEGLAQVDGRHTGSCGGRRCRCRCTLRCRCTCRSRRRSGIRRRSYKRRGFLRGCCRRQYGPGFGRRSCSSFSRSFSTSHSVYRSRLSLSFRRPTASGNWGVDLGDAALLERLVPFGERASARRAEIVVARFTACGLY